MNTRSSSRRVHCLTLLLASGAYTVTAAELERALAADRQCTAILAAAS